MYDYEGRALDYISADSRCGDMDIIVMPGWIHEELLVCAKSGRDEAELILAHAYSSEFILVSLFTVSLVSAPNCAQKDLLNHLYAVLEFWRISLVGN